MQRIIATLAFAATLILGYAFIRGWNIDDPTIAEKAIQNQVSLHFLIGMGALVFSMMVHALVLTYFMGTGRWIEETSNAYQLPGDFRSRNQSLKYRTLPLMVFCVLMLVFTAASGGSADPASPMVFLGGLGISADRLHLIFASLTLAINTTGHVIEYVALRKNGELVDGVLQEVKRIRLEKGLPV